MRSVRVEAGSNGFGGPLHITANDEKNKVVSVSGGVILPVAKKLAELLNCEVVDGFTTAVPENEIVAVVIDCGGTARCGVYPKKRIFTINVLPVGQSGPLAKFITPDIYVSDVSEDQLFLEETTEKELPKKEKINDTENIPKEKSTQFKQKNNWMTKLAMGIGSIMSRFYAAGRESVSTVIHNLLPFMAFVSLLVGFINGTGISQFISEKFTPLAGSIWGMLLLSFVCALPFLSPLLGPGAVIGQTIGVLIGAQIGAGALSPRFALPALFAINSQVGCDFIPVGLSMAEATPETIEIGTPAVLFSRIITGPVAVVIAYVASIGLYS